MMHRALFTAIAALLMVSACASSSSGRSLHSETAHAASPPSAGGRLLHQLTERQSERNVPARTALEGAPGLASFLVSGVPVIGGGASPADVPFNSCQGQWHVPSPLLFHQGNLDITLYLNQDGGRITGKAGYKIGSRITEGRVVGGISGNRFFARIFWTQSGRSSIGQYIGEIGPWSWIFDGRTHDELATPAKVTFFKSSQSTLFYCAPVPGYPEVVRQAVPAAQYQTEFDRFTSAGYRPVWVDGFRADGGNWFNVIFRPDDGTPLVARHDLTSEQYQAEFDSRAREGYRLLHLDSYPTPDGTRFASIFVKASGPPWLAYHDRSQADHQMNFNQRTAEGSVPVIISVTPEGRELRYSALYEKKDVGGFVASQVLDLAQYQAEFDRQAAAGRTLVYLNAYDDGGARFTAIWYSKTNPAYVRHGLTPADFQAELDAQRAKGLLTRAVTGYEEGREVYYAAFWTK
jgi:Polyglycine hydrolase-like, structural repeat